MKVSGMLHRNLAIGPRERQVLRRVAAGEVTRNPLFGDLAPWMADGRPVGWPLLLLALHGLIRFDVLGVEPPRLTIRGLEELDRFGV